MKSKLLILIFFATVIFLQAKSQEMTYIKGGKILFENKTIQKSSEIFNIISKKESPELQAIFKKYKSNIVTGQVFAYIGGFAIGFGIGQAISGKQLNGGLIAGGVVVAAIAFIFDNSANLNLKKLVDLYNGKSANNVSFQPFFQSELGTTKLGLIVKF